MKFDKYSMTRVITPSGDEAGPPFGSDDEDNVPRFWMCASVTHRHSWVGGFGSVGVYMFSPFTNAEGGGGGVNFGITAEMGIYNLLALLSCGCRVLSVRNYENVYSALFHLYERVSEFEVV